MSMAEDTTTLIPQKKEITTQQPTFLEKVDGALCYFFFTTLQLSKKILEHKHINMVAEKLKITKTLALGLIILTFLFIV